MNTIPATLNGVHPAAAMNAMPNGTNGVGARTAGDSSEADFKTRLNTYIYDYLLKNQEWDAARALKNSSLTVNTTTNVPPRKPKEEGGDDSKDEIDMKKPTDLPFPANVPSSANENSFLLEWFQLFWEMWLATQPSKAKNVPDATRYMEYTKAQNKQRQEQATQIMRQPGMMAGGMAQNYPNMMRIGQPGMMPNEMARRAQQNSMRGGMNHQQQMMIARMAQQQQMEREGSGVDMNGRPRTPSSGDNAPSPSKRARIEGQFPQQAMANGRFAPGMPDPGMLSTTNFNTFQQQPPNMQKRNLETYSQTLAAHQRQNMPQGMNGVGGQMMQPGMDQMEFYGNNAMRPGMAQNGGGNGSSNHALQDYQMQLMLLEQQNKKRLLMARQEQDGGMGRPDQGPGMPGQPGFAPNMSPSGSRQGPSPNPSEQMKRGTPKMGQAGLPGPGSPMPTDIHGRGSPGTMNFNGGMSMEMMQQMKGMEGMPMGQNGMRPPSSHPGFNGGPVSQQQIEQLRQQAQGARMPNGAANWPQGPQGQAPGVPQAAAPPNGQMGASQNRNAMPPPSNLPAANNNNAGNANGRPPSPAQPPAAAGTPQPANKPAPKKAKEPKDRKRPTKNKQTAAAATPSAEPEPPTPATPITPSHPKSFNENKNNNAPPAQLTTAQTNNNVPAPAPQMPPAQDTNMLDFNSMEGLDTSGINMQFGSMDTGDVLENFDFDAFLESGNGDELNLEGFSYGNFDGVEQTIGE